MSSTYKHIAVGVLPGSSVLYLFTFFHFLHQALQATFGWLRQGHDLLRQILFHCGSLLYHLLYLPRFLCASPPHHRQTPPPNLPNFTRHIVQPCSSIHIPAAYIYKGVSYAHFAVQTLRAQNRFKLARIATYFWSTGNPGGLQARRFPNLCAFDPSHKTSDTPRSSKWLTRSPRHPRSVLSCCSPNHG